MTTVLQPVRAAHDAPVARSAIGGLLVLVALAAPVLVALAPPAQAGPALLFDYQSGKVLYSEDPDDQWHPASLTKIMTAYVVFDAIRKGELTLDKKVIYSENASLQPPSKLGLPIGAEMPVDLALQALIVKSANDVAVMLAEAVGGSEAGFVDRMNATAARLGMARTHFVNANGLPNPEQVTTAHDLARLSRAVIRDFPDYAPWWALAEVKIGKRRLATHNVLLRSFQGADGLKTGFICDSGFNVVASATRDGHRLMAVVLGEPSGQERAVRAASLLEHGFQTNGWKQLFNTSTIDAVSLAQTPKSVTTIRETVTAWECGTSHKHARAVARAHRVKESTGALKAAADRAGKPKAAKPDAPKAAEAVKAP